MTAPAVEPVDEAPFHRCPAATGEARGDWRCPTHRDGAHRCRHARTHMHGPLPLGLHRGEHECECRSKWTTSPGSVSDRIREMEDSLRRPQRPERPVVVVLATEHGERDEWVNRLAEAEIGRQPDSPSLGPYQGVWANPYGVRVHVFATDEHAAALPAVGWWR